MNEESCVRVYIASPYTLGDPHENVRAAMTTWHALRDLGYSPYCPLLSHFLHLHRERAYEDWLAFDLEWLGLCAVCLRMPGESTGADREVAWCETQHIPVAYSVGDLVAMFPPKRGKP